MPRARRDQTGEMLLRRAAGGLAAVIAALALPGSAAAAVGCVRAGDELQVAADATGDNMTVRRELGGQNRLLINGQGCGDGSIFNVQTVSFTAQTNSETVTVDFSNGFLSTGTLPGGHTDFVVDGFGDTTVVTKGSAFSGTFVVAGADGIDADIGIGEPDIFLAGVGFFNAQGSNLSEGMTTAGGAGVGGPYTGAALLQGNGGLDTLTGGASATTLEGGTDDDTLNAGAGADASGGPDDDLLAGGDGDNTLSGDEGRDRVAGASGDDALEGGGGTDTLLGGAGDDGIDGGEGTDAASWEDVPGPVSASLASGTATGAGADTLAGIETLVGSPAGDSLAGGPGSETLLGGDGDDTLTDGGGADVFDGGSGTDTVSYAVASGPVTADLAAGTGTEAAAGDALAGFERVVGGPFADHLLGTPAAETLTGAGGDDTLDPRGGPDAAAGGAGADTLLLRDESADTGDCGDGVDVAVVDRSGDALTACETVQLPADPPPPPPVCVPAFDIPANGADENCDGVDARLRPIAATVSSTWNAAPAGPSSSSCAPSGCPPAARRGCAARAAAARSSARSYAARAPSAYARPWGARGRSRAGPC